MSPAAKAHLNDGLTTRPFTQASRHRREALRAFSALLMLPALRGWAQSPLRVAWLATPKASDGSFFLQELREGFRGLGYVEGANFAIEPYWGDESVARMDELMAKALASRPAVIVAQG